MAAISNHQTSNTALFQPKMFIFSDTSELGNMAQLLKQCLKTGIRLHNCDKQLAVNNMGHSINFAIDATKANVAQNKHLVINITSLSI